MIETFRLTHGHDKYQLEALVGISGSDIFLMIGGGTRPHIGCIAVAICHPTLKDPNRISSSASVITIPGHKEDEIARNAALRLSKTLKTNIVITAGIHVDDASPEDIEILVSAFNEIINQAEDNLLEMGKIKT